MTSRGARILLVLAAAWLGGSCADLPARPVTGDAGADAGDALPPSSPGTEILEPTAILDQEGRVVARGWARGPLFQFERERIPEARLGRLREWDFYALHTPELAASITLAKIRFEGVGNAVLAGVTVHDLVSGEPRSDQFFFFDTDDTLIFDPTPGGSYEVQMGNKRLSYSRDGERRIIELTYGDPAASPAAFIGGRLVLEPPARDSVALVTPFEDEGHFFYENKVLAMPASGQLTVDGRQYDLPAGQSFAVLDWVRGVMPAQLPWTWAVAMGQLGERTVGINLGSVFGDEREGTPSAVIVDGRLHKLDRVQWTYDLEQPARPWRFTSEDGRVDLTLTSSDDYVEQQDLDLGFYKMRLWKPYGVWSGTVVLDDGEVLTVDGLIGAAEYVETEW